MIDNGTGGNARTIGAGRMRSLLRCSVKDVGKQLGRARASYLGSGRRSGRRPDDQIGLGHIQPGIRQTCDDTDQPRVACRSATAEDQRSLTRGAHRPSGVDLQLILVGPRPVGGRGRGEVRSGRRCCVHGSRLSRIAWRALPVATTSVAGSWTAGEHPHRYILICAGPVSSRRGRAADAAGRSRWRFRRKSPSARPDGC